MAKRTGCSNSGARVRWTIQLADAGDHTVVRETAIAAFEGRLRSRPVLEQRRHVFGVASGRAEPSALPLGAAIQGEGRVSLHSVVENPGTARVTNSTRAAIRRPVISTLCSAP